MKENKTLYVFDLKNIQEQYAYCLSIIRILENDCDLPEGERLDTLKNLLGKVQVSGRGLNFNGSKIYYEQPLIMKLSNETQLPLVCGASSVRTEKIERVPRNGKKRYVYHLRIHMDRDRDGQLEGLHNLQYLALMLRRLSLIYKTTDVESTDRKNGPTDFQKKFSVFIVPSSGSVYPFQDGTDPFDCNTYQEISYYLRLLAQDYAGVIYGAAMGNTGPVVRALTYKAIAPIQSSFPLIPMEKGSYATLFKRDITDAQLQTLFALKINGRFGNANAEDPSEAIGDFIVETAYRRIVNVLEKLPDVKQKSEKERLHQFLSEYCQSSKMCIMTFAIFGFTFFLNPKEAWDQGKIRSQAEQQLSHASDLTAALSQIAQNTLQYSETQSGVLTFTLKQGETPRNVQLLDITLADFSEKIGLIDHFISNLKKELKYTKNHSMQQSYLELVQRGEKLTLRDFFEQSQDPDTAQAWKSFRSTDIAAHIGLVIFKSVIQQYNGSICFINNRTGQTDERGSYFHQGSYLDGVELPPLRIPEATIPGTQVQIRLSIEGQQENRLYGLGQLVLPTAIQEDYDTFANYLTWGVDEIDLSPINNLDDRLEAAAFDAELKRNSISVWEKVWCDIFQSKILNQERTSTPYSNIVCFRLNQLSATHEFSSDFYEIFLKGFFNAANEKLPEVPCCLAMIDAAARFMQTLHNLCISLAPKKFPKGLQLYFCSGVDISESVLLVGDTFFQAVHTAYQLSLEQGTISFSKKERGLSRQVYAAAYGDSVDRSAATDREPVMICPFDTILSRTQGKQHSLFDARIERFAEQPLDEYPFGYKLVNTHMRLGSKVHIQSFYEMSFLFYRTTVANRLAFEILRSLCNKDDAQGNPVDLLHDPLLFYGYASYSKALLTALLEIVKAYRKRSSGNSSKRVPLALASYQHNLQSELRAEETQLYFDFSDSDLGKSVGQNQVELTRPVKVIQIVPISSTLTTFRKMRDKLEMSLGKGGMAKVTDWVNFTTFWVTEKNAKPGAESCGISQKYWSSVNTDHRKVWTKEGQKDKSILISYFMTVAANWLDPLACDLCYPNNVVLEVPLVETDQTSTVPTQQVHAKKELSKRALRNHEENDARLLLLKDCVLNGHIRRERNHFAFYIDTQKYFNVVSEQLKIWLKELRNHDEAAKMPSTTILNVIFSPEHNTNVGFAQYVNNFYFNGGAEIVCINEDKQYRSNFKCEHMALIKTIESLFEESEPLAIEPPVRFFFADDTIVSGDTYHKANNFLRSLIPAQYQHYYQGNLFSKCFLLVDRMSQDSKSVYVSDVEKNFLSFVHIDVSNVRIQGDSCVGCKMQQNALRLFKRSATRTGEKYWSAQIKSHDVLRYDDEKLLQNPSQKDSFRRLIFSHIIQNAVFYENDSFTLGNTYDVILRILAQLLGDKRKKWDVCFSHTQLLEHIKSKNCIEDVKLLLELISRPFFSFDFKVRLQAQTLLLLLSENLFNTPHSTEQIRADIDAAPHKYMAYKGFLLEKDRIEITNSLAEKLKLKFKGNREALADFFQSCLLSGLVELRSTYLIRKQAFQKTYSLLKNCSIETSERFLTAYAAYVQQLLDGGNDETKSLRLEYILVGADEYDGQRDIPRRPLESPLMWPDMICSEAESYNHVFKHFGEEIFLQNSRVLFDGMEELCKNQTIDDRHFMDCWHEFRALERSVPCCEERNWTNAFDSEKKLFNIIRDAIKKPDEKSNYNELLNIIFEMASEKYGFPKSDAAWLTCSSEINQTQANDYLFPQMQMIDIVFRKFDTDSYFGPYQVKQRLLNILKSTDETEGESDLKRYGYYLGKANASTQNSYRYMFVCFDHPDAMPGAVVGREIKEITPLYLYFGFDGAQMLNPDFYLLLFLRDISSYRNRLLRILENHFVGDAISQHAHTVAEREILAHEKAVSHSTTGGDRAALEVLQQQNRISPYRILDTSQISKWLLLHNYTNGQIAKLFTRSNYFDTEKNTSHNRSDSAPPLYLCDDGKGANRPQKERPLRGLYDLCLTQDNRFILLGDAVSLVYDKELTKAQFIQNTAEQYYNAEYFRCILVDIIFSAMKFKSSSRKDFLEYVDFYLGVEHNIKNENILDSEYVTDQKDQRCVVHFARENSDHPDFDYLLIWNEVSCETYNIYDLSWANDSISARIRDPLDYHDGHMSLLTISRYIETLDKRLRGHCKFGYRLDEKDQRVYFESRLPVLEKRQK